ncbi:MAG: phosphodiester glycosidase family protein [Bacilli bacterium]|nr:phosphodiester glycosidase family protein [Bacilli bacterium]
MNRIIKRSLYLCFIFIAIMISNVVVSADEQQYDHLYDEISREKITITEGVDWTNIILNTKTTRPVGNVGGYGTDGTIDVNKWYGQQVNLLEVPRMEMANGEQKFELIVWSIQGDEQWDFASVTKMAEDFERHNPDYMVIGGINGDFYDWHTTNDYPNSGNGIEVSNGEVLRTVFDDWGIVGFNNDNNNDQLVYDWVPSYSEISSSFYLSVYDENGTVVEEIELDGMNMGSLEEGQTSAYFGHLERIYLYQTTVDENGNTVFVLDEKGNKIHVPNSYGEPTITNRVYHAPTLAEGDAYYVIDGSKVIYQAADDSYYGKGTITNVNDNTSVINNSFAIVTKNDHVKELLALGKEIRVQRNLTGIFEGIENAIGCYITLADKGAFPEYSTDSYLTTRAPRTIVGCKADGTVCLLTMDGRQPDKNYYGTNQEEINTILEQLDITEAYLLDGGGSSTFFVRENDKFVVKNSPSDKHVRSVSNGILIVTKKDESVKVSNINTDTNKVELDVETTVENITNAYLKIEDEVYYAENGKIIVDQLKNNTNYSGALYYQIGDGAFVPTTSKVSFATDKIKPTVTTNEFTFDDQYIYPSLNIVDPDNAISLIIINVGGKRVVYSLDPDPEDGPIKIARPAGDSYECTISVTYKLNELKSKVDDKITYNGRFSTVEPELPDGPQVDDKKSGCKAGAYIISSLIPLGLAVIILKRKSI